MITLKELLGLRPKPAATAAELLDAINQAEAAQREAAERAAQMTAQRGRVLVSGAAEDVERHEAALAAARNDAERAGAMVDALREKLAEVEKADRRAGVEALRAEAERARSRWAAFVMNEYPELADRIAAGLMLERELLACNEAVHVALRELPAEERSAVAWNPTGHLPAHPLGQSYGSIGPGGLGGAVRLPAANGDNRENHWPKALTTWRPSV
jgi:hypothetical protein